MPVRKNTKNSHHIDVPAGETLAGPVAVELRRRGMAAPALLFVLGHRPLAFAVGHLLAVAEPVAAVLGANGIGEWSRRLIAPGGADRLLAELQAIERQTAAQPAAPGNHRP
jgi:hypothetical protein